MAAASLRSIPDESRGVDRLIWQNGRVAIGAFRCPVSHPLFADSGPIRNHCFVFPRTSAVILPSGHRPFVGDRNIVPLYNANQDYRRRVLDPEGDRCDYFSVTLALLEEVLQARDPATAAHGRGFGASHVRATADLYLNQRTLFARAAAAGSPSALEVEEGVLTLLDDVVMRIPGAHGPRRVRPAHRDLADAAQAFLAREFARPLSLGDIADAVGASAFHLCRVFRAVTGVTLHQHREQLRLSAALERVEDGDDLTVVALDLGYSSHSHFSAAFRRAYGRTPSSFRRGATGAAPA